MSRHPSADPAPSERIRLSPPVTAAGTARAVGAAVRSALAGAIPPLAVMTSFSLGRATVDPERWAAALGGLFDVALGSGCQRRGANRPAPSAGRARPADGPVAAPERGHPAGVGCQTAGSRVLLADHDDLAALPACCQHWGHDQLAVGAQLRLGGARALILAPSELGYANLCTWLSWRHETPDAWRAWCDGRSAQAPCTDGLVWLVRDAWWWRRLRAAGCSCHWHVDGSGAPAPDGGSGVAVLLVDALTAADHRSARLLARARGGGGGVDDALEDPPTPHWALADLATAAARCSPAALAAGAALLARCRYVPGRPGADGHPPLHLPPARIADPDRRLRELSVRGIHRRYPDGAPSAVWQRLEHELGILARKRFSAYMLAVWDLARGRRTCGRGSAASSLVCYLLGLTNVDPVRYRLVFERFLSDERHDPPDIDIDFPWDERDAVLVAAGERYGADHVAMVATHQRLRDDGALREACRAHGLDRTAAGELCARRRNARRYGDADPAGDAEAAPIFADAERLTGLPRHFGLHCGGVVITARPIRELVPVHPAAKRIDGRPVAAIAWEKDGAEAMGLVKIDFLGNRSLAVVRDCLSDLRAAGIHIDEARWRPELDPLARRLVERGHTIGCFYIESPAMRLLNARAGTVDFDRLVVHSSIIRPAANRWIDTYLERLHHVRRHGRQRAEWYPHPVLRGLLSESFGVLSYQEDVMLVAGELAGFDVALQNRLRKALGRSDTPQRLAELAGAFAAGCRKRGVTAAVRDLVWEMITSFAGYSFCKAHSASYAMVSYQCAFLKAHHPAHFLARVITNGGGFYSIAAYVEEARRCGCRILAPCVVEGGIATVASAPDRIHLGLQLVAHCSQRALAAIVRERARTPFCGVADLRRRCRLRPVELRMLLWAGALDRLLAEHSPAQRSWLSARAASLPLPPTTEDEQLTLDLIDDRDPAPPVTLRPIRQAERDRRAWVALGCLPRAHPFVRWRLPPRRWRCSDLAAVDDGRRIRFVAWPITRKQVLATQGHDRRGRPLTVPESRPMAFVTLEDETGIAESVWFPDAYRRCGHCIDRDAPMLVDGRIVVESKADARESTTRVISVQVLHAAPIGRERTTGSA